MVSLSSFNKRCNFLILLLSGDVVLQFSFNITGYSLRTAVFRYTEWVSFDRMALKPDWESVVARELYHHQVDPGENMNLADRSVMADVVQNLSKQLRAGWRHSMPRLLRAESQ